MKKPIAIKAIEALESGDIKKAEEVEQDELNAIAGELHEILNRHHPLDAPYITAAMRLAADGIKASLPDSGKHIVDCLLETTECIAVSKGW